MQIEMKMSMQMAAIRYIEKWRVFTVQDLLPQQAELDVSSPA
jgi:hypothetical protein